ncbi:hypothetical protein [Crateriforma conspicua]|uniref:hypothetical protein n=1 Tax=Crateriforma conspicua TaxID=2527996 RepID=UPI001189A64B|nr:hypothetical protein [Crateriforma conspicua]QDV61756.1 hypothetical protein Mal65_08830 [Crateriforma conspicua]
MKDLPPIPRARALALLMECEGDYLWSPQMCREKRVPESWIDALLDVHESGFVHDGQTIYVDAPPGDTSAGPGRQRITNQYAGVSDVKLAIAIARQFGLDVERYQATSMTRRRVVHQIQQAIEEGE